MIPGFPGEAAFTLGSCAAVLALTAKRGGVSRLCSYGCAMIVGLASLSLMTRRNFLLYLAVLVLVSGEVAGMGRAGLKIHLKMPWRHDCPCPRPAPSSSTR